MVAAYGSSSRRTRSSESPENAGIEDHVVTLFFGFMLAAIRNT
jgi:hypothetical protein